MRNNRELAAVIINNIMVTAIWAAVAVFFRHWWITLFALLQVPTYRSEISRKNEENEW